MRRTVGDFAMKSLSKILRGSCAIVTSGALVFATFPAMAQVNFLSTALRPVEEADKVRNVILKRAPDAVKFIPEEDDAFGAAASGGDDAAQTDGAIADYGRGCARSDAGRNSSMMSRRHHVSEGEQRGHERVVFADGQDNERAIGIRHAHRLALSTIHTV